ncbi:MAG: hypothetical protein QOG55_2296, partial [Acidobacteriaceae bacterium]|nr:hypothetical protein [Acidobacteriaceae bacterium]
VAARNCPEPVAEARAFYYKYLTYKGITSEGRKNPPERKRLRSGDS